MDYKDIITILEQGANVWIDAHLYSLNQLRTLAREAERKNVMLTLECRNGILTPNEFKLLSEEGGRHITIIL